MMVSIPAPHGERAEIPPPPSAETIVYPTMADPAAVRDYYNREGYVVIRDLIGHAACDQMRAVFEGEVKPFDGYIYRQASANPERHVRTQFGYMLNSILNIHAVDPRFFPTFRQ